MIIIIQGVEKYEKKHIIYNNFINLSITCTE